MEKQIGVVSNYFANVKVAAVRLTSPLKVGDKVKIVGGGVEAEQVVKSMQIQHEKVEKAKKGDEIGVKFSKKVRKGYKVFKL
ncbi:MAG: hypothetical protein V1888_03515 [archaeon]